MPPPAPEIDIEASAAPAPPATIFTTAQKVWITFVVGFAAMFSTLNSYIYMPAIVPMARDLGASVALINLTVTSYLVVAAVAPAFMGDMADQSGRRPTYMLMFALMVGSNLGIALQTSYAGLFVLRMVQSAGSSGLFGCAYGVLSDITTVANRGSYVGTIIFFTSNAPNLGPVISGILANYLGWRSIFWFLVILTGAHFVVILLFLPETQRKVVGNGSIRPPGGLWYRSLFNSVCMRGQPQVPPPRPDSSSPCPPSSSPGPLPSGPRRKFRIPNPLTCLPMLFDRGNLSVILVGSLVYSIKMTVQTSVGASFIDAYDLDYLEAGLVYLPAGVGGAVGSLAAGRFLDRNYRRVARARGLTDENIRRWDGITGFPIETARMRGCFVFLTLSSLMTLGFGLCLQWKSHIAVPLVLQFFTGITTTPIFTIASTMLSDYNTHRSATAQASYNVVRCIAAAAFIAAQGPLVQAIGPAGGFGVFAALMMAAAVPASLLRGRGMRWREEADSARRQAAERLE